MPVHVTEAPKRQMVRMLTAGSLQRCGSHDYPGGTWEYGQPPCEVMERRLGFDFGRAKVHSDTIPSQSSTPGPAQAKLMVGSVSDPLEREADRIADRVMQTESTALAVQSAPDKAQRKCAACEEQPKGTDSEQEKEETLRMKSADTGGRISGAGTAPPVVAAALAQPGRKMDSATRAFFEPRFGHSLGDVRIHSDATAASSAEAVSARAYTVGSDIVFAPGQCSPGSPQGRWLLAHEIAHVLQQSGSRHGSATEPNIVRRQQVDGEMVPTTPALSPAPAAGATAAQPAPPTAPGFGSQDPAYGTLAPPEQPGEPRVRLMTFDCSQMLLLIDAGPVRQSYKLATCSLPVGSYEPVVKHRGKDFKLDFPTGVTSGQRFDFDYYVKPGQPNPATLLADQDKVDVEVVEHLPTPAENAGKPKEPASDAGEHAPQTQPTCVVHLPDRQLVAPDSGSRALFKPIDVNQTVWSHPIPLGQFGFLDVDANITGNLSGTLSGRYGPGNLTDICLTHQIDKTSTSAPIDHPLLKSSSKADVSSFVIGGRARFRLPASASVVILGEAALVIAADYFGKIRVGSIRGGLKARGEAGLGGRFDAMVDIIARFTRSSATLRSPIGDLSLEISNSSLDKLDLAAQVALQGHASLSFGLDAFAAVKFLGFELWRENWTLSKAASLGLGWEGGINYSPNPGIHWILGAIDRLEGIDDKLFDDESAHVDTDHVLGTLLDQPRGTQTTPDGLSKQTALPFSWHKPIDMYPGTLSIPNAEEPKELHRDDGPTSVRRNVRGRSVYERIGVASGNWVRPGNYLQYLSHAVESRAEQNRLRGLLASLGFDSSGTEVDHVRDLHLGGQDESENLWPLDQATNSAAGPRHQGQLDNYRQEFAARGETLEGRLFVISDVGL